MIEQALSKGHKAICIDNYISGVHSNIEEFEKNPNFKSIKGDINDPKTLNIETPIDYIIDLACPASPIDYRRYPLETLAVCSEGVKNLLNLAKQHNARFFLSSTSEVYGNPLQHPQSESYWGNVNSYGERSCYDEGKRFSEALTYFYRTDLGFNTGIVRIFNTYGPKMKPLDGRVVSTFLHQALLDEDITIFGDGSQTRSFCYISDQIEGQWALIHSDLSGPVNIGNPNEFTMIELAEKVIEHTGSKSKIVHKPLPADDPSRRRPDIQLAKSKLGWEPKVSLDEGIAKTISWFKQHGY
jgi:dTDP-glucose 4,6-dehydratase